MFFPSGEQSGKAQDFHPGGLAIRSCPEPTARSTTCPARRKKMLDPSGDQAA
jgi:hypothetical protein